MRIFLMLDPACSVQVSRSSRATPYDITSICNSWWRHLTHLYDGDFTDEKGRSVKKITACRSPSCSTYPGRFVETRLANRTSSPKHPQARQWEHDFVTSASPIQLRTIVQDATFRTVHLRASVGVNIRIARLPFLPPPSASLRRLLRMRSTRETDAMS